MTIQKVILSCRDPRISEVWCAIAGVPGPINEAEPGFIQTSAQNKYVGTEAVSSIRIIPRTVGTSEDVAAFWSHDLKWDGGRRAARFGHRFLSLHRLCKPNLADHDRYTGFEKEIHKPAAEWLNIFKDAHKKEEVKVLNVQFGYINEFPISMLSGTDITEDFNLRYAIKVPDDAELTGLNLSFDLVQNPRKIRITLRSKITQTKEMGFEVKISARQDFVDLKTTQTERILGEMDRLHVTARNAFFGFITKSMQKRLGARNG